MKLLRRIFFPVWKIRERFWVRKRIKEEQEQGIKKAIIAEKTNLKLDLKTFVVDEVEKMIELF